MTKLDDTINRLSGEYTDRASSFWRDVTGYHPSDNLRSREEANKKLDAAVDSVERVVNRCVTQGYIVGLEEGKADLKEKVEAAVKVMLTLADHVSEAQLAIWCLKNSFHPDFNASLMLDYLAERDKKVKA